MLGTLSFLMWQKECPERGYSPLSVIHMLDVSQCNLILLVNNRMDASLLIWESRHSPARKC